MNNTDWAVVCETCKHSKEDLIGIDNCRKASYKEVSPEGVKMYRDVTVDDALKSFRVNNGGKCPHYKRRLIYRICDLFDKGGEQ